MLRKSAPAERAPAPEASSGHRWHLSSAQPGSSALHTLWEILSAPAQVWLQLQGFSPKIEKHGMRGPFKHSCLEEKQPRDVTSPLLHPQTLGMLGKSCQGTSFFLFPCASFCFVPLFAVRAGVQSFQVCCWDNHSGETVFRAWLEGE